MELKPYNVTVRRFDPSSAIAPADTFVLPVDSPDEEHATSAAMSNCIAFTPKFPQGRLHSVAFTCAAVAPR